MKDRKTVGMLVTLMLVATGLALSLSGCGGIPKGTSKELTVGTVKLQAVGAGIVTADAEKVTFAIKCGICGFEPEKITIPTPAAGKPYTQEWVCPKCGNKQKIVIQVAA